MNNVTVVSALFNIERENMDGRKWEEYLKWFDITLKLKCPMYLFVTEEVREFVEERRLSIPTEIVVQTVEDIPYYYLKDKIQNILNSPEYSKKMKDTKRIECNHSMYPVIQYSKFPWLMKATDENPFGTDFFFWMDAGSSRFFGDYDLNNYFPSSNAVEALESMGESFLVQENCDCYPDLFQSKELSIDYFYDNRSYVLGTMFGGHKKSIPKVFELIEKIFIDEMIKNGSVNNEQIALGYLIKKYPDIFTTYERTNGNHMDIFRELS
jgi:hypothetical protein